MYEKKIIFLKPDRAMYYNKRSVGYFLDFFGFYYWIKP